MALVVRDDYGEKIEQQPGFLSAATKNPSEGGEKLFLPCWTLPPIFYHNPKPYSLKKLYYKAEGARLKVKDKMGNVWSIMQKERQEHDRILDSIMQKVFEALKMLGSPQEVGNAYYTYSYKEAIPLLKSALGDLWKCHSQMSLAFWIKLHLGYAYFYAAFEASNQQNAAPVHLLDVSLTTFAGLIHSIQSSILNAFNKSVLFSAYLGSAWVHFYKGDMLEAMHFIREAQQIPLLKSRIVSQAKCIPLDLNLALIVFHYTWDKNEEVSRYTRLLGTNFVRNDISLYVNNLDKMNEFPKNHNAAFHFPRLTWGAERSTFNSSDHHTTDEKLTCQAYGICGDAWFTLGIYNEALMAYTNSFKHSGNDLLLKAASKIGQGNANMRIHDQMKSSGNSLEKCKECYSEALGIYESLGHKRGKALALSNLGALHCERREFPQALEHFKLAKKTNMLEHSTLNRRRGSLLVALERWEKAETLLQRSLNDHDNPQFMSKHDLAILYLSRYERERCPKHLEIAKKHLIDVIKSFSKTQFEHNLPDPLQITQYESQKATYRLLEWCFAIENKAIEAFICAERGRSRLLMSKNELWLIPPRDDLYLLLKSPRFDNLDFASAWNCLAKCLCQCSFESTAVIEYTVCSGFGLLIYVLDLTTADPKPKVIVKRFKEKKDEDDFADKKMIENFIHRIVEVLSKSEPMDNSDDVSEVEEKLTKLYGLLIAPVKEELLPHIQQLVIIPHEVLFQVPFAALMEKREKPELFLIHKYVISVAESVRSLIRSSVLKKHQTQRALIIGIEKHEGIDEDNLEHAHHEAKEMAKLLGGDVKLLLDQEASKESVLEQITNAQVVHLATHGVVDEKYEQGAIILANPSSNFPIDSCQESLTNYKFNGEMSIEESLDVYKHQQTLVKKVVLEARDISKLVMVADLVVLSACKTGRGVIAGEGVVGLGRAFSKAGVPCSVLSLWPVHDEATAVFMRQFYTLLVTQGMEVAKAMRLAMLKLMKEASCFNDPLWWLDSWAPFFTLGLGSITIRDIKNISSN